MLPLSSLIPTMGQAFEERSSAIYTVTSYRTTLNQRYVPKPDGVVLVLHTAHYGGSWPTPGSRPVRTLWYSSWNLKKWVFSRHISPAQDTLRKIVSTYGISRWSKRRVNRHLHLWTVTTVAGDYFGNCVLSMRVCVYEMEVCTFYFPVFLYFSPSRFLSSRNCRMICRAAGALWDHASWPSSLGGVARQ